MASKLEQVLINDRLSTGNIGSTLCHYLDDGTSLYCMRATSCTVKASVDLDEGRLWGVLHLHAPFGGDKIFSLERISPHCHTLTIKVKVRPGRRVVHNNDSIILDKWTGEKVANKNTNTGPQLLPSQDLEDYEADRALYTYVFKRFKKVKSLTLTVDGDPAWPDRGEIEVTLACLRCSIERAELENVRSLVLSPIHLCGILHLRWSGFGALYETPSPKIAANLWQSMTLLEIRLRNPMYLDKLTEAQSMMYTKILQDYLRSFTYTLKCLRFVWLDGEGPSPMLLDDEPGMGNIRRLFWPVLEELSVGNILVANKTIQAIPDRAPKVRVVKALRSTHRFSRIDPEDGEAWVDVEIESSLDRRRQVASSWASSFYSQEGL